jgi:hypothetical protein
MKYLLFIAFVIGSSALFVSCKKDKAPPVIIPKTIDTLYPLSYLPVYPGSYWKYVDSNGDSTIDITNPTYELDYWSNTADHSDTYYAPMYNGIYIWGYQAHKSTGHPLSPPMQTILSENLAVGSQWEIFNDQGNTIMRKIIVKDTTITISGIDYYPTIGVEEYQQIGPATYLWYARRYYTKDIGLIKEELHFPSIITKEIYDYHINN